MQHPPPADAHEPPAADRAKRDGDQAEYVGQNDRNVRREDGFGQNHVRYAHLEPDLSSANLAKPGPVACVNFIVQMLGMTILATATTPAMLYVGCALFGL